MANKEAKFTKEETSQPTNEVATQLEEAAAFLVDVKLRKHMQRDNVITHMPFLPEEHVKDLLGPELKKSRFVEFQEQFSEDMFFKKPKIGKVSSLKAKPDTFTNENFTYGIVHLKSESVYGLIMPQKSVDEIQQGYTNLTAKRVCRHYNEHFNPNTIFGISKQVDPTGCMVKRCMQHSERLAVVNKIQKIFNDGRHSDLGKTGKSHENLHEESTLFGKKSQVNSCNVRSLLQDITTPCSHADIDVAMNEAIGYIRRLRRNLYKCRDFHIHDLKQLLRKSDKDSTGFITLPKLFHVLDSLLIRTNEKRIRKVMSLFKILLDEGQPNERVNIELFWKMLHIQHPLPAISIKSNANGGLVQETTTYKEFCKDRDKS